MLPLGMRAKPCSAFSQNTRLSQTLTGSSVSFQPVFRRASMRLQALAIGQFCRDLAERLCACFADVNDAGALLKIVHTQRRRKACSARSRQHMVRSGAVIAQRFGREATK